MKKKFVCLFLALAMALLPAAAFAAPEEQIAASLKSLSLFKGVSDNEFDLGRAPSRVEALVIMLRLLGKESEALSCSYEHPFSDVPAWADRYIAYAYETGLTKGMSKDRFGTGTASDVQFLTFVLRAMGYREGSDGDFVWDRPYELSESLGVTDSSVSLGSGFLRADCARISWNALGAELKGSDMTLAEKLIDDGVFTEEAYKAALSEYEIIAELPPAATGPLRYIVNGQELGFSQAYRAKPGKIHVVVMRDGEVFSDYTWFDENNQPYSAVQNPDGSLDIDFRGKGILDNGLTGTICVDLLFDEHYAELTAADGTKYNELKCSKANFDITLDEAVKGLTLRWHGHDIIPGNGFGGNVYTNLVPDVYLDGIRQTDYTVSATGVKAKVQADGSLLIERGSSSSGSITIECAGKTADFIVYL